MSRKNSNLKQFAFKVIIRGTVFADNRNEAFEMVEGCLKDSGCGLKLTATLKDFEVKMSGGEGEKAEPIFYHSINCKCKKCQKF